MVGFFNWSADLEQEMGEVTTYQSNGWKENIPTIKGFSASAESYRSDSEFSVDQQEVNCSIH